MKKNATGFRQQLKLIRWLIVILLLIILLVIGAAFVFSMTDECMGRGTVEGLRTYNMKSSVQSRITRIHFRDGDTVKAGTVLLELDRHELNSRIETLRNTIREMAAELAVKEAAFELLKHDPLPAEYRHTKIAREEGRLRLATSKVELEAYANLRKRGVIAELDYNRHEMEVMRNQMELNKLEEDYAKLSSGLAQKIIRRAEADMELLKLRIEGRKKELSMLEAQSEEYLFVAPEDGVISYIPTKIGSYVEPGQSIVQFAAGKGKKFVAYIDEVEIYKIQEGQSVRIASSQYSTYEYGYFEGEVMYIGELPVERTGKFYYPVFIRITVEPESLRLGSSGEARINTGSDRIIRTIMGIKKR